MKWLIQSNVPSGSFDDLLSFLDNNNREVRTFKCTNDYLDEAMDINKDPQRDSTNTIIFSSVEVSALFDYKHQPLFSTTLIDQNKILSFFFGTEYLNYGSLTVASNKINKFLTRNHRIFVKPADGKIFPGRVFDISAMSDSEWKLVDEISVSDTDIIVSSTIFKLKRETRFWVINGKIITGSIYAIDGLGHPDGNVPQEDWEYANVQQKNCNLLAYTLDVALVEENGNEYYKVVEINNILTSGVYDADIKKLVEGIEDFFDNSFIQPIPLSIGLDAPRVDEQSRIVCYEKDLINFLEYNHLVEEENILIKSNIGYRTCSIFNIEQEIFTESYGLYDRIMFPNKDIALLYKMQIF